MEDKICLDTDFLVNFFRNNKKAVSILLSRINVLNFSIESAKKAGEILAKLEKEGKPIKFRFQQNRRIKYCRLACLSFLHNLPVTNKPEPVANPPGNGDSGADIRAYRQFQLAFYPEIAYMRGCRL